MHIAPILRHLAGRKRCLRYLKQKSSHPAASAWFRARLLKNPSQNSSEKSFRIGVSFSHSHGVAMTDEIKDFADLKHNVEGLKELLGLLGQRMHFVEQLQAKALEDLRKELDLIHKNQRFLYERVAPIFKTMFPNDW